MKFFCNERNNLAVTRIVYTKDNCFEQEIMEQITSAETSSEQLSDSPPSKRAKHQPKDESVATSSDETITGVNLNGSNPEPNQHSTNTEITDNQQPS